MNSREPREPRGHDILLTRAYHYANFADLRTQYANLVLPRPRPIKSTCWHLLSCDCRTLNRTFRVTIGHMQWNASHLSAALNPCIHSSAILSQKGWHFDRQYTIYFIATTLWFRTRGSKRNNRIFQRSLHHDNSPKSRILRLIKKVQILFTASDLGITIFHLINSYTNMCTSCQPECWELYW